MIFHIKTSAHQFGRSFINLHRNTYTFLFVKRQFQCQYQQHQQRQSINLLKSFRRCCRRRQVYTSASEIKFSKMSNDIEYMDIPDKSEYDKKQYKTLRLPNGIRALLISDPSPIPHDGLTSSSDSVTEESCSSSTAESSTTTTTTSSSSAETDDCETDSEEGDEKLAACAVLIDVGSFLEPRQYQGLAHFLEHMIFMGSEKYPLENAFDAHIKKCGGFSNANTECEETLFYFEVSEPHLDSSLDYFTALLKAPLMKKEAMTRERLAVESEYQQIKNDDETRRDQILASLARSDYPHATFTWGNLESLQVNQNDDELHKVLHEFRKDHYSAQRMVICLQARLPIDDLENLVIRHFSDIEANKVKSEDFKRFNYQIAFQEDFHKQVFFVSPVENVCKLELTWVLPPLLQYYRCKPEHFLSYLIGYEGEGSLCAYLRKKLWGLELLAGIDDNGFDSNSIYSLFNVCIYLTDDGFKHLDEVIEATFAYIKLFANCGSLFDAYTELQQIEETGFRFQAQRAAFDNVQALVTRTKYYPPKDILTSTELYYEYNEAYINDIIRHINEFKFNIMITSQQKYDGIVYDKKEKWFGTDYTTINMPKKWKDLWENCKPNPALFLPHTNPFISSDFRLLWAESGKPHIPMAPKKLIHSDICELWFRQDDTFELPESFMYFYFISPLPRQSAKNDVLCTLYAQLVKFCLVEQLYPATVAGLSYQFYSAEKGVVLKVNGYNEKLHLIVEIITKAMVTMAEKTTEEMLDVFIKYQIKNYFNSVIKAKTLNKDIRLSVIENIRWQMIDKYKCLSDITLDDMKDFCRKFTDQLYVQALMQGNMKEELAHNVMNSVLSTLNCHKIKDTKFIENRTVQLPLGENYIRAYGLNDKDTNTVITNYYQIGASSIRTESILDMLIMFVEEPLFDQLRTKEQLGYYVNATVRYNYGIAAYSITVNSQETKTTADHVEKRIESFRNKMLNILQEMCDEEFETVRNSLIKIKMVVDMSLSEEVARNWGEITSDEYFFDRRRKEVEILRTIEKSDIIDFLLNNERTNFRKLSVQVIGHRPSDLDESATADDDTNKETRKIDNVSRLKNLDVQTNNAINEASPDTPPSASSKGDNDSSVDDSEADSDELFKKLSHKIDLVLLPKDADATTNFIDNIKSFKENLFVYPVIKRKHDDSTPNGGTGTVGADRIEDC